MARSFPTKRSGPPTDALTTTKCQDHHDNSGESEDAETQVSRPARAAPVRVDVYVRHSYSTGAAAGSFSQLLRRLRLQRKTKCAQSNDTSKAPVRTARPTM